MDNMSNQDPSYKIHGIFPCPVYIVKRDSGISLKEKKDIKDVIGGDMHKASGGMRQNFGNSISEDTYIFNSKLKEIKQFCEHHIKIYVEQIIKPAEDLDFYITQSWINVNKPGQHHPKHNHQNSIMSGVFYVQTVESDEIMLSDPNIRLKDFITFGEDREFDKWNSCTWSFPVTDGNLFIFPSWLEHQVLPNPLTTTDRISLAFNTFVRGFLGDKSHITELTLK